MVGDPLHPVARVSEEILRCGLDEVDPLGHRQREKTDESHVVVERKPGDHHLTRAELRRLARRVEVGRQDAIGDHHTLRFARRPARVLQDHEPVGIMRWEFERITARHVGRAGHHRLHRLDGRVAFDRGVEGGQLVVDQHELGVAVTNAGSGRLDEHIERTHPHRERQHHRREPGEPAAADDRHQVAAGRAQHGDVVTRHEPFRLERCGNGTSLVVDLIPANVHRLAVGHHRVADESDSSTRARGCFESCDGRVEHGDSR